VVGGVRGAPGSPHVAVDVDGTRVGTLYLRPLPRLLGGLDQAFASAQWHDAQIAGGVALIVALLFAFALARWLLAPVRALASGMHALGGGDFAQRIEPASSDELGALARDFNHLAQTLEQHRDVRRRWGADIAHELRTPLAVLRGEISALQDGVRSATPAAFDSLQAECARLSSLIEDLYQLALADAGALEYRFETLDLGAVAREAVELQRRVCADAGLALEFVAPDEVLPMRGDARRLAQLFDNLLSNARRYTDAPGRIRLGIAHGSTKLRLTVDDSAPGVPDAALPRLFDRLYRVEESRSRSAGGAGLGLAICRAIVEAHDGRVTAAPSPLGGLQIAVELPLTADTPP
jgi:two-component system, OmpR family, sensor histidine kinase BaeS